MRLIMMGTGPFALPTFRYLLSQSHDIPVLITRPARPGVGKKGPPPSPMRMEAEARGIPVWDPEDVNDPAVIADITQLNPDLLVVCDYGQILASSVIATARLGGINLHGSLLPKYRGAAPINWAIYRGESETGVSVIHLTPQLDGGPILSRRVLPIRAEDDAETLEPMLAELGVEAVAEAIGLLETWNGRDVLGELQAADQVTRARRLRKEDGRLDWHRTARQLFDQIRALKPWPGTYTYWYPPGKPAQRWIIDRAQIVDSPDNSSAGSTPGEITVASSGRLCVATGDGSLELLAIQPAGKRVMPVGEFLRGQAVAVGQRLGE